MRGCIENYGPLSKAAVKRILQFDHDTGFGPNHAVRQPNRNRFYIYLTQRKSDVQVRTVAVKSAKRWLEPVVKEVAVSSVDDSWIWVKDVACYQIAGYQVDWSPEGIGDPHPWSYRGMWDCSLYSLRGMWKINAPVVNPELLKRTRRFRWSDYASARGHILDYLKVFSEHPEIELLSKAGLGRYCTKVSIVRKLAKDREFRTWFGGNADEIRECGCTVPTILKAYGMGCSFREAQAEISARQEFYRLPKRISAVKALRYVDARRTVSQAAYAEYLRNCEELGLDLDDTKVSFPKQFARRQAAIQERIDALRAKRDAVKNADMNARMAEVAKEFQWLESLGRSFRIVIPRSVHDLVIEGRRMSNCLGDYGPRIRDGKSLIVFVRDSAKASAAFVAVEYNLKQGIVSQCYGHNNSKPPKAVRDFVTRTFTGIGRKEFCDTEEVAA